jgi:hypothetical protein
MWSAYATAAVKHFIEKHGDYAHGTANIFFVPILA